MGDVALGDAKFVGHEAGNDVAVRIVPDDQVRPAAEFGKEFLAGINCVAFKVGPYFKTGYPVGDNIAVSSSKRNPEDEAVLRSVDFFDPLVTGCSFGLGDEPGQNNDHRFYINSLLKQAFVHLPFQGLYLVKDIDDLAAGIRPAQNILLCDCLLYTSDAAENREV